jgi:hypothetical protein
MGSGGDEISLLYHVFLYICTIQILDNIGSLLFISWAISMKLFHAHLAEKYQKIKYVISLAATGPL